MDLLTHIASFLAGLVGGSLLTIQFTKKTTASGRGTVVDQSKATASGDIVGGNKTQR